MVESEEDVPLRPLDYGEHVLILWLTEGLPLTGVVWGASSPEMYVVDLSDGRTVFIPRKSLLPIESFWSFT